YLTKAFALAVLATASCNEIFGLDEGKPYPTSSSTSASTSGSSTSSGTQTSSSSGTGGAGGGGCVPATATTDASSSSSSSTGSGTPVWNCLGSVTPSQTCMTHYFFNFRDGNNPATGLTVDVCKGSDANCSNPMPPTQQPDGSGHMSLDLPTTFIGYL